MPRCLYNKTIFSLQLTEEPNGNTLVISLADENDAGDYICQVSTYKPTEIKHSVRIRGKINCFFLTAKSNKFNNKFIWIE